MSPDGLNRLHSMETVRVGSTVALDTPPPEVYSVEHKYFAYAKVRLPTAVCRVFWAHTWRLGTKPFAFNANSRNHNKPGPNKLERMEQHVPALPRVCLPRGGCYAAATSTISPYHQLTAQMQVFRTYRSGIGNHVVIAGSQRPCLSRSLQSHDLVLKTRLYT